MGGLRIALPAVLLLQVFCVVFFVVDAFGDFMGYDTATGVRDSDTFEYLVVLALTCGLAVTAFEVRRLMERESRMESALKAASGAFAELMTQHFDEWGLTASERDVAILAVKGFSISEIAAMRERRDGTVKAQLNAIYRKADVSGRAQLVSLFVEELMGEALIAPAPDTAPA